MRHLYLSALAILALSAVAGAQTFSVDPIHSSFIFKVKHLDTGNFYGRFNKASGEIKQDNGELSAISILVEADSIDTNNKARDEHLRNPDFFNTKEFPDISFKSTGVTKSADNEYEVTGELTLHGTTKPITVKLTRTGAGKNVKGADIVGYETSFQIKRSEYGMSGYVDKGIGDDVTLIVALEAIKQ